MSYPMMKELFYGDTSPWDNVATATAESRDIRGRIELEKKYFNDKISPDDRKRFDKLSGLYMEAAIAQEVNIFSHGFAMGALIMMEVMEKKKAIIK